MVMIPKKKVKEEICRDFIDRMLDTLIRQQWKILGPDIKEKYKKLIEQYNISEEKLIRHAKNLMRT